MDYGFKILLFIIKILEVLTQPVYWFFNKGKQKRVSPPKSPLLEMSATELATKIRRKQVCIKNLKILLLSTNYVNDILFFGIALH